MINSEEMKEFLREKVSRDIITKYLFIKTIEKDHGDEYIKTKYRLNAFKIRSLYKALDESEREKIEEEIIQKIEAGEIVLEEEAVNWHRESLRHEKYTNNEMENER